MSGLRFERLAPRVRIGLKGPGASSWLAGQGIAVPLEPNTWMESAISRAVGAASAVDAVPTSGGALLVARLGASEFFLEAGVDAGTGVGGAKVADTVVRHMAAAVQAGIPGVYPVLREDAAFLLSGEGALDVFTQVCNVNFAALDPAVRPVIMTLLIGVSVLIVPQTGDGGAQYWIWCDPTFGSYVDESVGTVVMECGGSHGGVPA